MRFRKKSDMANNMPRHPRHWWGRHHPACPDYYLRHRFSARSWKICQHNWRNMVPFERDGASLWGFSNRPCIVEMVFLVQFVRVNVSTLSFVSHLRYRPTGCISGAILFFFLNLNSHQGMSLRHHLNQFDFLGLTLLMSGIVCILLGLDSGDNGSKTIVLLCVGPALLVLAAINEILTSRSPIIPPRLFKVSLYRRGDNSHYTNAAA